MNSDHAPSDPARLVTALARHLPVEAGLEPKLRSAFAQLAAHPGKLVRAFAVLHAAEHHGLAPAAAEALACAVEFHHTASLLLDDLPCMDNADLRRGQPCLHRVQGEATAILAALALINRAYALIGTAFARQPRAVRLAATAALERALGTSGLVGGQAWDLAFAQTDRSARTVGRIAHRKTGALFALVLVLPALPARPDAKELRLLHALAVLWGQQFQLADDLRDVLHTTVAAGKTTGRDRALGRPNLALALGVPAARARLHRLGRQSARALAALEARSPARWGYLRPLAAAVSTLPAPAAAAA